MNSSAYGSALPNQRLQLALLPIGVRPLAVLRGDYLSDANLMLVAFVLLTPTLRWGAAEPLIR